MLSWIRSSEAQASNNAPALATDHDSVEEDQRQEDWVVLPCDHTDLMEASVSDLDLLSASMTLYRPSASSHPASSRSRTETTSSSSGASCSPLTGTTAAHAGGPGVQTTKKSRRQLKQELRHQQAMEELERRPRYDPMIAKMRDHEFKMAKMAKLGLRSGRIMSSSNGGPQSAKSTRSAGGFTAA
ncbi:hypothetical protein BGZ67_004516 [Mortierella alpina]|nr:hypothetical protein BGZ67_004516 [Mortierella alpina]